MSFIECSDDLPTGDPAVAAKILKRQKTPRTRKGPPVIDIAPEPKVPVPEPKVPREKEPVYLCPRCEKAYKTKRGIFKHYEVCK